MLQQHRRPGGRGGQDQLHCAGVHGQGRAGDERDLDEPAPSAGGPVAASPASTCAMRIIVTSSRAESDAAVRHGGLGVRGSVARALVMVAGAGSEPRGRAEGACGGGRGGAAGQVRGNATVSLISWLSRQSLGLRCG